MYVSFSNFQKERGGQNNLILPQSMLSFWNVPATFWLSSRRLIMIFFVRKDIWAIHGSTAMPGQLEPAVKQASNRRADSKNQINNGTSMDAYQLLSW